MGKGGKKSHSKSRGERKEELERKRDERARRSALRKEKQAKTYYSLEDDEDFVSFSNQLQAVGLKIKDIPGDGNCLFRALADQIDGDHNRHAKFRQSTVQFMRENTEDFQPFHDGERPFNEYLELLEKDGTFAGNDAIVAFARDNNVDIVIHQYSSPRFVINAPLNPENIQLHLAYHNGEHYSSLRRLHDTSNSPAHLEHNIQIHTSEGGSKRPKEESQQSKVPLKGKKKPSKFHDVVDALSENETNVMDSTSCKDPALVKQALEDNGQDVDAAIAYILQLLSIERIDCPPDESELMEKSSESQKEESNGHNEEGKKNNHKAPHLSNRQRKELAKQAKKKRRLEEQKAQGKTENESNSQSQSQGKDVGTVMI